MELVLGALASGLVQLIKKYSPNQWVTLSVLAVAALVISGVYTALVYAEYWETVYQVILSAGAIYSFLILRFEK